MAERTIVHIGTLKIRVGRLPSNHHGPKGADGKATTLRRTWLRCPLWPTAPGVWARRLWVYGGDGRCAHVDLYWTYDAAALAAYRADRLRPLP